MQLGTAYLKTPEATVKYKAVLGGETCVTNVFTGRLARGVANRFIRELGP